MNQFGSPHQWFSLIESQVPRIIDLVIGVWEVLPPPAADELENRVTNLICARLQNHPERHTFPFHIQPQDVLLEPGSGDELGRTDIAFKPFVPSDAIYFCLECKRLNVRDRAGGPNRGYYAEYVQHGMLRFARGQYADSVSCGGMLGFVLDGNLTTAVAGVEDNIHRLHPDLGMAPPGSLLASSIRPTDARMRETRHTRAGRPEPFLIQHLFVAGNPLAQFRPEPRADEKKRNRRRARDAT